VNLNTSIPDSAPQRDKVALTLQKEGANSDLLFRFDPSAFLREFSPLAVCEVARTRK